MSELVHRIFLAPIRPDVERVWAHEHWTSRHADVFARTPGVVGYVQNRPRPDEWADRTQVCAEAWFADRAGEKAAFGCTYYRTEVAEDEGRFVQRDRAWVAAAHPVRRARNPRSYRVLVFGVGPDSAQSWMERCGPEYVDVFDLQRTPPTGGDAVLTAFWTDNLQLAREITGAFGPVALLARPEAVLAAPEPPWTTYDTERLNQT